MLSRASLTSSFPGTPNSSRAFNWGSTSEFDVSGMLLRGVLSVFSADEQVAAEADAELGCKAADVGPVALVLEMDLSETSEGINVDGDKAADTGIVLFWPL